LGVLVLGLLGEQVLVLKVKPVLGRVAKCGAYLRRRLPGDLLLAGDDL
jgi:hypothetical protein